MLWKPSSKDFPSKKEEEKRTLMMSFGQKLGKLGVGKKKKKRFDVSLPETLSRTETYH